MQPNLDKYNSKTSRGYVSRLYSQSFYRTKPENHNVFLMVICNTLWASFFFFLEWQKHQTIHYYCSVVYTVRLCALNYNRLFFFSHLTPLSFPWSYTKKKKKRVLHIVLGFLQRSTFYTAYSKNNITKPRTCVRKICLGYTKYAVPVSWCATQK